MNAQPHFRSIYEVACELEVTLERFAPARPPHSDRVIDELHAINYCYLQLLIAGLSNVDSTPEQWRLAAAIAKSLAQLSDGALSLAAQCPYSLFDVAFDDFERWRRYCECPSDHLLSVGGRRCVFANTALFFAWHFTNADEPRIQVQARIVLGLDPRIAQLLRRISLPKLMEIAPHVGSTMRPRWLKHPRFWPDLISTASQRSPNKLRAVRLLGRQMLAAEALRTAEGSIHPVNNKAASK